MLSPFRPKFCVQLRQGKEGNFWLGFSSLFAPGTATIFLCKMLPIGEPRKGIRVDNKCFRLCWMQHLNVKERNTQTEHYRHMINARDHVDRSIKGLLSCHTRGETRIVWIAVGDIIECFSVIARYLRAVVLGELLMTTRIDLTNTQTVFKRPKLCNTKSLPQ